MVRMRQIDMSYRCMVFLFLCIGMLLCTAASLCPIGCCCLRPGFLVVCESLGLLSLPHPVPVSATVLSLAKNQLCNVDHQLHPFLGLRELSLSHNMLARFPRGLPPSLEVLCLQQNRIVYITLGALRKLGNLTRLDLKDNRIRAIQPGALQGLEKLQVLLLKGNKLSSLPPNLSPSLVYVDLSAKCIRSLRLTVLDERLSLDISTFKGCLSFNRGKYTSLCFSTPSPGKEIGCIENTTIQEAPFLTHSTRVFSNIRDAQMTTQLTVHSVFPKNNNALLLTPNLLSSVLIWLLVVLYC